MAKSAAPSPQLQSPQSQPSAPAALREFNDEALGASQPKVRAGDCPRSTLHQRTRVYRTVGTTRYCVCDDCGATWKVQGPAARANRVE